MSDPSMPCEDCEQGLSSCCPDYSYAGMIAPYIEAALKLDQDMIETACEKSIQGGKHGVLVLRSGVAGPVVSAEVDESVPYGKIYERALE